MTDTDGEKRVGYEVRVVFSYNSKTTIHSQVYFQTLHLIWLTSMLLLWPQILTSLHKLTSFPKTVFRKDFKIVITQSGRCWNVQIEVYLYGSLSVENICHSDGRGNRREVRGPRSELPARQTRGAHGHTL